MVVADAGYKTPAIAHRLLEDGIQPLFPYTRPKTKEGFFGKHDFAYDEYYNCYICPGAHILTYSTTNRNGYKEYKSCGEHCAECQYLSKCTESKDPGKTRLEHSQIFVDFEENKKKNGAGHNTQHQVCLQSEMVADLATILSSTDRALVVFLAS